MTLSRRWDESNAVQLLPGTGRGVEDPRVVVVVLTVCATEAEELRLAAAFLKGSDGGDIQDDLFAKCHANVACPFRRSR